MMSDADRVTQWLEEQRIAQMIGWDFSHIEDRYEQDETPWDIREIIKSYLQPDYQLLDMDTGGGEFLLSLEHPCRNICVTEAYAPNVAYCREKLEPLGIRVYEANGEEALPFADNSFDMVINRHGSYTAQEIYRVLKPGGIFATQQVGERNDRELVRLLMPEIETQYPGWDLSHNVQAFRSAGFEILQQGEAFPEIRFYDVGALIWFARIIAWEFPGFSVETCMDKLWEAQRLLEEKGVLSGKVHRFLLVARKV